MSRRHSWWPFRSLYRAGQFFRSLRPVITAADQETILAYLPTPGLRRLFARMDPVDQQHALAAFHALRRAGETDPDLLAAVLLHDAGKSLARVRLWHRVLVVLLGALAPGWLPALASAPPGSWRYPLAVYCNHPALGAELAAAAGATPLMVRLIRLHQSPPTGPASSPEDRLRQALYRADNDH